MTQRSNRPFYLPLKDLLVMQKGKKPAKLLKRKFDGSIPYLDIEALEKGNITQFADKSTSVLGTKDDIFVVWDGSRSGLVTKGREGAVGSTLMCLTPLGIDPLYLYHFLRSKFDYLNKNTTGASIPHINPEIFYNLSVPVIPLEMQKKIVADLEQQLDIYDQEFEDITSELDRAQEYRQSVLEQGITGQLTREWRKKNTGEDILVSAYNLSMPSSWRLVKLSEVTKSIADGDHQSPKKVSLGVPFILISNIQNGVINFSNTLKVSEEYYSALKSSRKPKKGDILFTIVGSIGNVVLIKNERNFCFQRHIALVRPSASCLSQFLYYQLLSNFIQQQALERSKGVAQLTLNLSELRDLQIFLPSLEEQHEIVRVLVPLLDDLRTVVEDHLNSLEMTQRLKLSVLESAFSFELRDGLLKEIDDDWSEQFLSQINIERGLKQKILMDSRKKNRLTRGIMKETDSKKSSLFAIIKASGKISLPIEEVWQQSEYYISSDIEGFYSEIESKSKLAEDKAGSISWQFAENDKDQVTLKIMDNVD